MATITGAVVNACTAIEENVMSQESTTSFVVNAQDAVLSNVMLLVNTILSVGSAHGAEENSKKKN